MRAMTKAGMKRAALNAGAPIKTAAAFLSGYVVPVRRPALPKPLAALLGRLKPE